MGKEKKVDKEDANGECEPPKKTHNVFETDIDKKSNFVKVFQLVTPILMSLASFIVILYSVGWRESIQIITLIAMYYVPIWGKEFIIPMAMAQDLDPLFFSIALTTNDVLMCLFLIWNFSYVEKFPLIGKWLRKSKKMGRAVAKKYKSFRSIEFIGLVLFIALPIRGSGGVMGTLVGLMLGMNPYKILLAMFIGTFAGALIVSYVSDYIWGFLPINEYVLTLLIVIFLESLIIIRMVYGQFYKKSQFYKKRNGKEC